MCKKKKLLMFLLCTFVLTFSFGLTCFASESVPSYDLPELPVISGYGHYFVTKSTDGYFHLMISQKPFVVKRGDSEWFVGNIFDVNDPDGQRSVIRRYRAKIGDSEWNYQGEYYNYKNSSEYNTQLSGSKLGICIYASHKIYDTNGQVFFSQLPYNLDGHYTNAVETINQLKQTSLPTIVKVALLILSSMVLVVLLVRFGKRWFH